MWDSTSDIVDSIIFQKSSQIGINTTTPAATLDVSGKTDVRDTLALFPKSTDNRSRSVEHPSNRIHRQGDLHLGETFPERHDHGRHDRERQWTFRRRDERHVELESSFGGHHQCHAAEFEDTLKSGTAGGLTVPGAITLGSSHTIGLKTCSANQVLQYSGTAWTCKTLGTGTGTVTSVGSGAGLTGGPITTSGTLSIATAGVTNTMLQHSSLTLTPGTGLTGAARMSLGNIYNLNIDTTKTPLLSSNNTFTATQNFTGNPGITVNNTSADGIDITAGSGIAVYGFSSSSTGVDGFSNGFDGGVFEASSTGAYGSRSDSFAEQLLQHRRCRMEIWSDAREP